MDYIETLKQAIKRLHDCDSRHVESVPIREVFQGQTVWDGNVEVFDLIGHAKAKRCYAWAFQENDKDKRFIAVLELPPVNSPRTAVQAAIIADAKK